MSKKSYMIGMGFLVIVLLITAGWLLISLKNPVSAIITIIVGASSIGVSELGSLRSETHQNEKIKRELDEHIKEIKSKSELDKVSEEINMLRKFVDYLLGLEKIVNTLLMGDLKEMGSTYDELILLKSKMDALLASEASFEYRYSFVDASVLQDYVNFWNEVKVTDRELIDQEDILLWTSNCIITSKFFNKGTNDFINIKELFGMNAHILFNKINSVQKTLSKQLIGMDIKNPDYLNRKNEKVKDFFEDNKSEFYELISLKVYVEILVSRAIRTCMNEQTFYRSNIHNG